MTILIIPRRKYSPGANASKSLLTLRCHFNALTRISDRATSILYRLLRIPGVTHGLSDRRAPWANVVIPTPQRRTGFATFLPRHLLSYDAGRHVFPLNIPSLPLRPLLSQSLSNTPPLPSRHGSSKSSNPYIQARSNEPPRRLERSIRRPSHTNTTATSQAPRTSMTRLGPFGTASGEFTLRALGLRIAASNPMSAAFSPMSTVAQLRLVQHARSSTNGPLGFGTTRTVFFSAPSGLPEVPSADTPTRTLPQRSTAQSQTAAQSDLRLGRSINGQAQAFSLGDLYLESTILGRWLTQHLNRQIEVPRPGIRSVDPRITPAWDGPSLST